jgi:hypothetical protein
MREFDAKWKTCVARAREGRVKECSAPFGFATRVLAASAVRRLDETYSLENVWQQLTMRSLGGIALLLLACALLEVPHLRDRKPLDPGIENTVAQLVWHL